MKYVDELPSPHEALSALADGELSPAQAQALVQASRDDAHLMQSWASYHAIGQALRAHASDAKVHKVHRPAAVPEPLPVPASVAPQYLAQQAAANESVFRWKLLAGVAALAAVGTMLWALVGPQGDAGTVQLAQRATAAPAVAATNAPAVAVTNAPAVATQTPAVVASTGNGQTTLLETPAVMIRDPRLDELLAAHKQFGGASALQQPAGFLRNATFQTSGR